MKKQWLEIVTGLLVMTAGCSSSPNADPDGSVAGQVDMASEEDDATLLDLEILAGALSPTFAPLQTSYTATAPFYIELVTLTPTAKSSQATIAVNGQTVLSGMASQAIALLVGMNPVTVDVTTSTGKTKHYNVIVTRAASSIEYLNASNTGESDYFGWSVSLSGNTLAVGARLEDSSATGVGGEQNNEMAQESGAVYIFVRSGAAWTQQAYLKASNTGESDSFGYSVSLSGDTLAVGAPYEDSRATGVGGDQTDNNAQDSGAVYVFTRSGSTWNQQAYLKASNTGPFDSFGWSLSLSGSTLAVGAIGEDSNATGVNGNQDNEGADLSGAVYVFTRSGSTWAQQAYLKASNTGMDDQFGESVSLSGDTLAVGAPLEDSQTIGVDGNQDNEQAPGSGAVYVFTRAGSIWAQQAYLKAFNTGMGDEFGYSVSLSGDILAVGAPLEDAKATGVNGNPFNDPSPNSDSGAVYVFTRQGSTWAQHGYLKASNTGGSTLVPGNFGDGFGLSVSLSGDILAVGAPYEDSKATGVNGNQDDDPSPDFNSGAVYVFARAGSTWSQQAYVKASNPAMGDLFGRAVSVSSDALAVGAIGESLNANGSGAVYVY